jgi:hypothetical protein
LRLDHQVAFAVSLPTVTLADSVPSSCTGEVSALGEVHFPRDIGLGHSGGGASADERMHDDRPVDPAVEFTDSAHAKSSSEEAKSRQSPGIGDSSVIRIPCLQFAAPSFM